MGNSHVTSQISNPRQTPDCTAAHVRIRGRPECYICKSTTKHTTPTNISRRPLNGIYIFSFFLLSSWGFSRFWLISEHDILA
ncbi:hypothetical protein BJX61DRAFT_125386 [Aspergillus egyptiacus]|nr:hypothetical protein BJX61DRAFT_125386 [Aspergillus egyptiacus]